jgi:hypothetical protein
MIKYAISERFKYLPRFAIALVIIVGLFALAYYAGFTREYCGSDTNCFEQKATSCKPAEVYMSNNNNIYYYKVSPTVTNNCLLKIKFARAQEGTSYDHISLLEGKSMTCKIPKKELSNINIVEMNNVMMYCSGPLKESLYELIIKRMYELVIVNLAEIAEQAEEIINI